MFKGKSNMPSRRHMTQDMLSSERSGQGFEIDDTQHNASEQSDMMLITMHLLG